MKSLRRSISVRLRRSVWTGPCVALTLACSDGATLIDRSADTLPEEPSAQPGPAVAPAELGPVYALQTMVSTDDSVTSYVSLSRTLDLEGTSLAGAREFPGYAFITVVGGKLLVSDGERPTITRYEITADLGWRELDTVSFANQGVTGGAAGFERHWFLDETTAYVTLDVTKRVIWNPTDMLIRGVMEDSALELTRDGLQLDATFNRQPRRLAGPVLKPFYYRDADWFKFGPTTPIAVYDPVSHVERAIVDVPCPALEVPSQDEAGNTYFSAWTYGPTLGLYGEGPALCVRRLKADGTLDEEWAPDLTAATGGRPVKVLRYMRDGLAVGTVLHVDEVEIDFSAGYDDEAAAELDTHWRLWLFDLQNETASPIQGIDTIDSGFLWANFDGRSFVFVPYADWGRSKIFELGADSSATEVFDTDGVVNEWLRVR
jgi:hypothetical protein